MGFSKKELTHKMYKATKVGIKRISSFLVVDLSRAAVSSSLRPSRIAGLVIAKCRSTPSALSVLWRRGSPSMEACSASNFSSNLDMSFWSMGEYGEGYVGMNGTPVDLIGPKFYNVEKKGGKERHLVSG